MNDLIVTFDSLYQSFRDFEKTLDKIIFARIHLREDDQQIKRFNELLQDLQNITSRIQKDVNAIKKILRVSRSWKEEAIEEANLSLSDLFTTYEIVIARYKSYVDKFGCQSSLENSLKLCTSCMDQLDQLLYTFNSKNNLKLLIPSEESEIVKTIMSNGYKVVTERDWSKLVVYR